MVGIPGLFFVIANDDHARFVRPDPDNGLHTIGTIDLSSSRCGDVDRAGGPAGGTGPPDPAQVRFADVLTSRIDEDRAVDLFSHLVLVAPAHLLRELTAAIAPTTAASLLGSLARDLVNVPDLELWPWLLPWLQPARTTWAPAVPTDRW